MLRRRDADTTSYVADYLTRSVRRASGLVLVGKPEVIPPGLVVVGKTAQLCVCGA